MFWSIWRHNDVVFNHILSILQVIFRGTHWFRFCRLMQKEESHQEILNVCQSLEVVATEIFAIMDGDHMLELKLLKLFMIPNI